jgi:hypothetical protein
MLKEGNYIFQGILLCDDVQFIERREIIALCKKCGTAIMKVTKRIDHCCIDCQMADSRQLMNKRNARLRAKKKL